MNSDDISTLKRRLDKAEFMLDRYRREIEDFNNWNYFTRLAAAIFNYKLTKY